MIGLPTQFVIEPNKVGSVLEIKNNNWIYGS